MCPLPPLPWVSHSMFLLVGYICRRALSFMANLGIETELGRWFLVPCQKFLVLVGIRHTWLRLVSSYFLQSRRLLPTTLPVSWFYGFSRAFSVRHASQQAAQVCRICIR